MSGASRASASASGFSPLAFMCSAPLSSSVESVPSSGTKVSIAIEYMVKLTGRLLQDNRTAPAPEHSAQSAGRPRMDVFGCMHVMHMAMGGVYDAQAMRTPAGWRIRNLRLDERRFEEAAARLEAHMSRI